MNESTGFSIGGRGIGSGYPPFVIAEMSGNHNQSLARALALVDAAARAGAHALKIQTYTADTMTLDLRHGEFMVSDPNSLWAGQSLYELYQQAYTPWEWHKPIFDRAASLGMLAFSTPFDETAVDFLETLGVPVYKIASFENTDLPLIKRVASTGKPMIISTGMATVSELELSVKTARQAGCEDLILLKCTSTYPAAPANTNLQTIPHMRELFGCDIGLSDHTMGLGASVAAVALGACVIEKHFTLNRSDGGVDAAFSLEPHELHALLVETRRAYDALGQVRYGPTTAEKASIIFRRSLYVVKDIAAGELLSADNVRAIRPGLGLAPRHYDAVMGKNARTEIKAGTALQWQML
jgi:pseudaminic acid synthase